ncbi:uncharacterized protein ARMOST_01097 [Armillaria ostoyae]|uniref:CCHC-type domain-containing protein n=1 Tax=Armillaria ostoyae TaxID=47428 RepID=A0A284QN00_ARMOS|nr:uncharacterized protein ARMOST_01097 [Armillaria ostoyae]
MPSDSKYDVEKLDNTNYYDWAYAQKLQLIKKRLWDTVNGNDTKPLGSPNHVTVKAWVRKDEEALATIVGNVHKSQYHLTRPATTSKMAWDALEQYHTTTGLGSIVATWRQLFRMKKAEEGVSLRDHIGMIQSTVDKLKSLGEDCSDRQVIAIIMETLPSSYESLIIALDSHPSHNKLEYVISRIFNEEVRQKEEHDHATAISSSSMASDQALLASARRAPIDRSTITCHTCGQKGHFKNECGTFPFNQIPATANANMAQALSAYISHNEVMAL